MSSAPNILSRALNDRFNDVSNAINLAQGFADTMYMLVRAANLAFEQGDISVGGSRHFIMDIEEATIGSPLKDPKNPSLVLLVNLHDTCTSDLRAQFSTLSEAGLALIFKANGTVSALTTHKTLPENGDGKLRIAYEEQFRVQSPNAIEEFVAKWLRRNLDSKTMVEIQNQLNTRQQKDAEAFWVWSPQQRDRLAALTKG
jgi:hypothetical protein